MRNFFVSLASLLAITPALAAPSFDCAKARTTAERAICASADVSQLDSEIADAYKTALTRLRADANAVEALKADQRIFMRYRDEFISNPNFDLMGYFTRRRDFLRQIDPVWRDGFSGDWQSIWGETRFTRKADGKINVSSWTAHPATRSWTCGDPSESIAAEYNIDHDFLQTGTPANRLRYMRQAWMLYIENASGGDSVRTKQVAPTGCGHGGVETGTFFPISKTPFKAKESGLTAMDYFRLVSGANEGNNHRFYENAAQVLAPPLTERKVLLNNIESASWRITENTSDRLRMVHKTAFFEVELQVKQFQKEFLRVTVTNPHESKIEQRHRRTYFTLLDNGVLDFGTPNKMALAGDTLQPPIPFAAIPPAIKTYFEQVDICYHYSNEEPFNAAEEKRLRTIMQPAACKQLPQNLAQVRASLKGDVALNTLLDRAIVLYQQR